MIKIILLGLLALNIVSAYSSDTQKISCSATLNTLDLKEISKMENSFNQTFDLVPMSTDMEDDRTNAIGTFTFLNNYEVAFSATLEPKSSILINGNDVLIISSRLQRRDSNGKVTVLAVGLESSDTVNSQREIELTKKYLFASVKLENPEISTAIINSGERISAYGALKRGLVDNGIATESFVSCIFEK